MTMYAITDTSFRCVTSKSELAAGERAAHALPAALLATLAGAEMRAQRDALLRSCDWTQVADAPLNDAQRVAWLEYRQTLRSIPDQPGFPAEIQWPDIPNSVVT
jgi:hypothetical protein